MNGRLGGVGKQIGSDLFELGKSVVKGVGKVAGDTVNDSIEQILSAPVGVTSTEDKEQKKRQQEQAKQQKDLEKKQIEKRQFQEVRGQLEEYIQHKKQVEAQRAQEQRQQEQEDKQKEGFEKQKKDSFLKQLMKRLAGSSHGETDRQKE
ncbi:hypothetical protein A2572_04950 [Candidatus Collierbacteria bacterium RIFOXYD1_FULL_40_9]|uniref:Uncharacterized protein n=1 Tax=Candidatus Collierbacteria bacterium RIFOXYD1_FULL_40_9 TaxID=1817731 RepID=A0A1F5FV18_9BACT|nr:MAG: hypothetical protein A2572_04950 [Candidatus Collierbacteria bacterium RIFOXYD1_FULL_40_9]